MLMRKEWVDAAKGSADKTSLPFHPLDPFGIMRTALAPWDNMLRRGFESAGGHFDPEKSAAHQKRAADAMAAHQAKMMDAMQPYLTLWYAFDPLRHMSNALLDAGTCWSRRADSVQKQAQKASPSPAGSK